MTPKSSRAVPTLIVERFDGGSLRAQRIIVAAMLLMAAAMGMLGGLAPDDDVSAALQLGISMSLAAVFAAASWMFGLMRLELQVDDRGFTARVRPFRRLRIDARSVTHAELVEVEPFSEFGGWWDKGRRGNRLLGGAGRTALRVTYLRQVGAREPTTCRLTLLSTHAQRLFGALQSGERAAGSGQPADS